MSYNVPDPSDKPSFSLTVKVTNLNNTSLDLHNEVLQPTEETTGDPSEGPELLFSDEDAQKFNKGISLQICTRLVGVY